MHRTNAVAPADAPEKEPQTVDRIKELDGRHCVPHAPSTLSVVSPVNPRGVFPQLSVT
jgi:hypothetical protein